MVDAGTGGEQGGIEDDRVGATAGRRLAGDAVLAIVDTEAVVPAGIGHHRTVGKEVTVNVKLDWNAYVGTLAPKGRLHFVGATLDPLDIGVFPLLMGQRSISGSPVVPLRVMATPVALSWPMLPKTMATILTAVPRSCGMLAALR